MGQLLDLAATAVRSLGQRSCASCSCFNSEGRALSSAGRLDPSDLALQEFSRCVAKGCTPAGRLTGMPPFMPLDDSIHWNVGKAVEVSKGFTAVFGTSSAYEAYLFAQVFRQLGANHLLGSGCSEKEVEDLVHASAGPTLLFVVDNIARDCGIRLVRRLKGQHPDLKAMLLVNSQETYARNPAGLEIYDGIAAGSSVGRGSLLACVQAVIQGRRYLDALLRHVEGNSERSLWNALNQRERETGFIKSQAELSA